MPPWSGTACSLGGVGWGAGEGGGRGAAQGADFEALEAASLRCLRIQSRKPMVRVMSMGSDQLATGSSDGI